MIGSRGARLIVLLGAVLAPCTAGGYEAESATAASKIPAAEPAGYVFPSSRDQLRTWAMNCVGPAAIAGNLAGASWRQWVTDEPPQWDEDAGGFAKRFGTASATTAICETSLSLASAAMGQDATYYRSPRAGLLPRATHALAMTVLARNQRGEKVFSPGKTVSPFLGPLVVQETLYPEGYNVADALLSGVYNLLINAGVNAAREFIFKAPGWDGEPARAGGATTPAPTTD